MDIWLSRLYSLVYGTALFQLWTSLYVILPEAEIGLPAAHRIKVAQLLQKRWHSNILYFIYYTVVITFYHSTGMNCVHPAEAKYEHQRPARLVVKMKQMYKIAEEHRYRGR